MRRDTPLDTSTKLEADLKRAEATLEANISIPLEREMSDLSQAESSVMRASEKLVGKTKAMLTNLQQSAKQIQEFNTNFQKLDSFHEWLAQSAKESESIANTLKSSYELLQQ